jgi:hypothetical protein
MVRLAGVLFVIAAAMILNGCSPAVSAEAYLPPPRNPADDFAELLARQRDLTYRQLFEATPQRQSLDKISFDPATAKFYDEAVERLKLTSEERDKLAKNGFVSVDHDQRYSFGALYHAIYTHDLPVLITTDSILHAMHRTYDDLLTQLETGYFTLALDHVLTACHDELANLAEVNGGAEHPHRDVDLYLTVARNLLKGAGAPTAPRTKQHADGWDGKLLTNSKFDQDGEALALLERIQFGALERDDLATAIYGGSRPIDYSQFKPRGHYTHSISLSRYFRTMMWLGRADTAWIVLPPDPQSGIRCDSRRELSDAVLLTQLLRTTGALDTLRQVSDIIDFLVGRSDDLSAFQLTDLLDKLKFSDAGLLDDGDLATLEEALRLSGLGVQHIRAQVVESDVHSLDQVATPAAFQLFGQRFVVDSFVLSKVVYDSILFDGAKIERTMPAGLDVMYALGNDAALPLLEKELTEFPYAANLKASRDFVDRSPAGTWQESIYNGWLGALRTLDEDLSSQPHAPEAMRTSAWQRKQLQTQLASWSELRHNTVLYAKPPYTSIVSCEYPTGYVEPYPELYARIKLFADETARRLGAADFSLAGRDYSPGQQRTLESLRKMSELVGRLETLARKELAAEPFTEDETAWVKEVISRGGGCGPTVYSGWYSDLFLGGAQRCSFWEPTIVDLHTNPNGDVPETLEAGVGDCNFLVVAIDNEGDRMIYVGPTYSYYEFLQPAEDRLTDEAWGKRLEAGEAPPRPAWTAAFQGAKLKREGAKAVRGEVAR